MKRNPCVNQSFTRSSPIPPQTCISLTPLSLIITEVLAFRTAVPLSDLLPLLQGHPNGSKHFVTDSPRDHLHAHTRKRPAIPRATSGGH